MFVHSDISDHIRRAPRPEPYVKDLLELAEQQVLDLNRRLNSCTEEKNALTTRISDYSNRLRERDEEIQRLGSKLEAGLQIEAATESYLQGASQSIVDHLHDQIQFLHERVSDLDQVCPFLFCFVFIFVLVFCFCSCFLFLFLFVLYCVSASLFDSLPLSFSLFFLSVAIAIFISAVRFVVECVRRGNGYKRKHVKMNLQCKKIKHSKRKFVNEISARIAFVKKSMIWSCRWKTCKKR